MKLALSNIAWNSSDDAWVADMFRDRGIRAVEVAPTKIWPKPLEVSESEARRYRDFWRDRGVEIVAMQALLFGKPELAIFETAAKRREMLDYLDGIMRLASWLGCGPLVFGSPKNRRVGDLDRTAAWSIAVDFFRSAGELAQSHGVCLCIEPNPPQYACDFVTNSTDGRRLVDEVGHPGFGLHLDAAGMTMAGESIADVLPKHAGMIRHFHASEPELGRLALGGVRHDDAAMALRAAGYSGFCSVEMRYPPEIDLDKEVARVINFLQATYGRG